MPSPWVEYTCFTQQCGAKQYPLFNVKHALLRALGLLHSEPSLLTKVEDEAVSQPTLLLEHLPLGISTIRTGIWGKTAMPPFSVHQECGGVGIETLIDLGQSQCVVSGEAFCCLTALSYRVHPCPPHFRYFAIMKAL